MNPALRALNRFGLGARPGESSALGDPRSWLMAQLDDPPPLLDDLSLPRPEGLSAAIRGLREAQRARDTEVLGRARAPSIMPHPGPATLHTPQPAKRSPANGRGPRLISALTVLLKPELLEEPLLRFSRHLSFDFHVFLDPTPLEFLSEQLVQLEDTG